MFASTMCRGANRLKQARFFPVVLAAVLASGPALAAQRKIERSLVGKNGAQEALFAKVTPKLRKHFADLDGSDIAQSRDRSLRNLFDKTRKDHLEAAR